MYIHIYKSENLDAQYALFWALDFDNTTERHQGRNSQKSSCTIICISKDYIADFLRISWPLNVASTAVRDTRDTHIEI